MRVTLDNTSPLLQFVSVDPEKTWIQDGTDSEDNAINKYFRQTMTKTEGKGNYMALEFTGTEIWVYGAKRGNHGNYSVSLDGRDPVIQTGKIPDPGTYQSVLYQATKLDVNTPHYIQVTNIPESDRAAFFDIDYVVIKVDMDDNEVFTTRLDDTSPECQYTGQWGLGPPRSPETYYNTTAHISQTKGDEVTCSFDGSSIEVVGGLSDDHGNYTISIDGGAAVILNGSHPSFQSQATLFLATHLDDGPNSIIITNTESSFDLDYIVVNSTIDPSAEVNLAGTTIIDPISSGQEPSPNKVAKSDPMGDSGNAGMIGAIIGGVAGLVFLCLLAVLLLRKCRERPRPSTHDLREKYHQTDPTSRSSSIRPSQVDLTGDISPFIRGMYTYQDSPGEHKRSPPITGPPHSACAFHPYRSGSPRSIASSVSTNTLILGMNPVPTTSRYSERQRHDRQASISDILNGMPETAVTKAWTKTDEGTFGGGYTQPRPDQATGPSSAGPRLAETVSSEWSPRPRGAQFSLPPLALPPKMFVLGQDGEVEPLGTPGGSGRSSMATRLG